MTLKLPKVFLRDKRKSSMTLFLILMTSSKFGFCSVNYRPVRWFSLWRHQSSSFHKGYHWYKFRGHTISGTWDIRGRTLPHAHIVLEKRCSLEGLMFTTFSSALRWRSGFVTEKVGFFVLIQIVFLFCSFFCGQFFSLVYKFPMATF